MFIQPQSGCGVCTCSCSGSCVCRVGVCTCVRQKIYHSQMKNPYDILDHLYEKIDNRNPKAHVATLCKPLAECECSFHVMPPPLLTPFILSSLFLHPHLPTFSIFLSLPPPLSGSHWRPSCAACVPGGRGSSWSTCESSCTKS